MEDSFKEVRTEVSWGGLSAVHRTRTRREAGAVDAPSARADILAEHFVLGQGYDNIMILKII